MSKIELITVSQLNRYVKSILESDKVLREVFLRGEISNLTVQRQSGHFYFTVKDESASIRAVMFRGNAQSLPFIPDNGLAVILRGAVSLYEKDGGYQFIVSDMQPDGFGALHLAYEQLKNRLGLEGLFDSSRKRPIPELPQKIGIITSPTGAAIQDMLSILSTRYPIGTVLFLPSLVQGRGAADEIAKGIAYLNRNKLCDVIIIGRGGGSLEELWAFNEEPLVRAVACSSIPVISAVGHETDFSLCDFAADLRAATPTAAAQLVAPDIADLADRLELLDSYLRAASQKMLNRNAERLDQMMRSAALVKPIFFVERNRQTLDNLIELLGKTSRRLLRDQETKLSGNVKLLDSLSPLKVLSRGYTITLDESGKHVAISSRSIACGDRMVTRFEDGEILSVALERRDI